MEQLLESALKFNLEARNILHSQKQILVQDLIDLGYGFQDFARLGDITTATTLYRKSYPDVDLRDARNIVLEFANR